MMFPLFRRGVRQDTISTLYGTIVAQARMPSFYRDYAVPDTVDGRFDLLVLHLAIVLDRLAPDPTQRALGQSLFDRFCQDMDHNLREMGIGDMSVPKEMQRIGAAFYGRAQAYRSALAAPGQEMLVEALNRNIYGGMPRLPAAPARLAAYMREAVRGVGDQGSAELLAGTLRWPDPNATVLAEDKRRSGRRLKFMEKNQHPWSVPVALDDIPETGLHLEVEAPENVRSDLVALAGVRELTRLSAVFDLARRGAGVRVTGHVSARVGQTCVVTLEPVENDLQEAVDLTFSPTAGSDVQAKDGEDPPEPLIGNELDVGAIATEFLLLGIDPYPRKAGATFAPIKADDGSAKPFAALEALKKQLGSG
jgi:cytochrome b pre-mRNA-processing protein 3